MISTSSGYHLRLCLIFRRWLVQTCWCVFSPIDCYILEHYRRLSVIFRPLELQQMRQFRVLCLRGHPAVLFDRRGTTFKSTSGRLYRFSLLLELDLLGKKPSLKNVAEVFVSHLSYFSCFFTCAWGHAAVCSVIQLNRPALTSALPSSKTWFITDSTFPENLARWTRSHMVS